MDREEREKCYKNYIETFGKQAQIMICIEEMSELTKELCKYFRAIGNDEKMEKVKENIIEETADVLICAEQIRFMFGSEKVDEMIEYKIKRGAKRAEEYRKKIHENKKH